MGKDPELFRVMSVRRYSLEPPLLSLSMPAVYGLQTVEGKDSLQPRNLFLILPTELRSARAEIPTDFRLLNAVNVKYVMTGKATRLPETQFELIYDEEVRVFRNKDVMPRAFFVPRHVVVPDVHRAVEIVRSAEFEPARVVVLEEDPGVPAVNAGSHGRADVRIRRYEPRSVEIELETDRPGFVVLSDTYYPGWRAAVDGREVRVWRANGAMRAMYVTSGHHRVVLEYVPLPFRVGLGLSASAVLATCSVLVVSLWRRHGGMWRRD